MEEKWMEIEKGLPTHSLLLKEQQDFIEYQKILQSEEEAWRLKSWSLWLKSGDRKTNILKKNQSQILEE